MYEKLRPEGLPRKAWNEILTAWENGLSDREASFRAMKDSDIHITASDIREMCMNNPEIGALKEFLQADLLSQAKLNIASEIREGNIATSKWLLERKAPNEFSTKAAVAFEGAVAELTMEEKQEKMAAFLAKYENG